MSSDEGCNLTALALGLSFSIDDNQNPQIIKEKEIKVHKESGLKFDQVLPSLSLGPQQEEINIGCFQTPSNISPDGSSYSNSSMVVKKEEKGGVVISEDFEVEKAGVSSRGSDEDEEASPRKKLRLTKEQSAVLEDSFKEHSTLNPNQKQALARQLNLRPRQVEVWFQNRRARTKLKQTEMDCELLKKCCENLTEENKRLHRELQELRALKLVGPTTTIPAATVFMQMPAATLSMCPSCDRINAATTANGGGSGSGCGGRGKRFVRSC